MADIEQMAQRLDEKGAAWVAGVEYRDIGLWFGTVEDPDGNHVQLGLTPVEERDGGLRYTCGSTEFVVFASTGKASGDHTQRALTVADLDSTMNELRRRGVEFEGDIVEVSGHYPSTGATGERAAWFHDGEGNLIGLGEHIH